MNLPHLNMLADFFLPKPASNLAGDSDWAWNLILYVTGFFFVVVVGAMTLFIFKYRRRTPNEAAKSEVTHNTPLEIAWTFIPLVLVVWFFWVGFKGFMDYDTPPSECAIVDVLGQKWSFTFTYPNGATSPDLYVIKDQPVRLNMHSVDVLHALYLPNLRTQRNLVPYRQTTIWFVPTEYTSDPRLEKNAATGKMEMVEPGGFPIYCTQYCGNGHSKMTARCYVLDKAAYEVKMTELANPFKKKEGTKSTWTPYFEVGRRLYSELGCKSCHSLDGSAGTGPTWQGLWKRDHDFAVTKVPGYTLKSSDLVDKWDEYLIRSMVDPDADLVIFGGKALHGMTSFATQLSGSESNVEKSRALVEFIKSLNPDPNLWMPPALRQNYNADAYDADKHPEFHPESRAATRPATQSQPGQQ